MGKGRVENLSSFGSGKFTVEQEREIQSAGGRKSGHTRQLQAAVRRLLATPLVPGEGYEELLELLHRMGIARPTMGDAASVAQLREALGGSVEHYRVLRDTVGERPAQGVEIAHDLRSADLSAVSTEELLEIAGTAEDTGEIGGGG